MTIVRSSMTETHPVSESYESLRDSVENVEARAAWNDADRRTALLTDTYRSLRDDPRFTEAHKSEQMWEAYEKQSTHIQAAGEKAREELEKDARGHEMMSIPRPKGENIFNLSTERLIAAQNEAARIARKTQRLQGAPGPFKPNTADVLGEEYAKGIEAGGVEGVAICKGALMAADELGIAEDEFLNGLRTPEQLAALEKAERCRRMAFSIAKSIPEPPPEAAYRAARERLAQQALYSERPPETHQGTPLMAAALVRAWRAFADAAGTFIEEAAFRVELAFQVLAGRVPVEAERRWWNRATETPTLVDIYDWTDERLVFSVLVWPSLESPPEDAPYDHRERVGTILEAIAQGSADRSWSVRWELDGDLRWDDERQVWVGEDGFAYDGERLYAYSRRGEVG